MAPPPRNLVNLKSVSKGYGSRTVLDEITLGVAAGDRIGIVGRNGDGKSTLLRLIAGLEDPDRGQITRAGDVGLRLLGQTDTLDPDKTVRAELVHGLADHEWAADRRFRDVLDGLLGGVDVSRFPQGMDTPIAGLSGGERRRIDLARLLLDGPELLLLDEPTNHLDVEGVDWLARHLAARRGAMLVVTHDRWFLDAVCTFTWEVSDGTIHQYEGGYAAYVLARAERDRQASAREDRRQQLVRKELAWLRRGPPARTSKPKFRIEAANALIADEPEARDRAELLRFAGSRLGNKVLEAEGVSVTFDGKPVLRSVTWRLGPGDRVGLVGVNGAGKTTLVKVLGGELEPTGGHVERGATVRLAHLSQNTEEIPGHLRVLESLEEVRGVATTSDGQQLTAGMLCDRFGFRGERARTLVKDLSGGERRRLQLMRLLMDGPNVLILDEPTNDLDIDTLTALEDLLDQWPGTLVVVSHDRYFVERVCDDVHALMGDGGLRHLPGGIEQYVELRRAAGSPAPAAAGKGAASGGAAAAPDASGLSGGEQRAARKELAKLERALGKLEAREAALHEEMAAAATDHGGLRRLQAELAELVDRRAQLESDWLETSEALEG
ncbi:ABC-F family ATP-binding cassette domain-containing protein [Paraconexibacter antarcticus]|uniref:ABC-F family ATP-binding cassette domain-containing protein n=1 Tax=Paraconexibacter antarcticus TaxID=2949664 RepID=A0ABY5DZN8_9ACTN|nr:ABC-F family ATP-binding cassette domain-containing protein [Paraconexibacter antarcticus]UTI66419.1 ABC-F family ATP-binding cassette domain-containing protein [Paraconexibacter antarcticus]